MGSGLFLYETGTKKEPPMPTLEELISVLLPVLPDAEVALDEGGQVVIYTGLMAPTESA